jgi:hypothetical protein
MSKAKKKKHEMKSNWKKYDSSLLEAAEERLGDLRRWCMVEWRFSDW